MFTDARKAHLNPVCEEDEHIELPEECGVGGEYCGKLNYWLYGFRPAAAAWEKHYSQLLEGVGFVKGRSCGVVFHHPERDVSLAVHGDDFTFCGYCEDLMWIKNLMETWFEIKLRGILGPDDWDDKGTTILGRKVRWGKDGIRYEADEKHRELVLEHFGFNDKARGLGVNGDKEEKEE